MQNLKLNQDEERAVKLRQLAENSGGLFPVLVRRVATEFGLSEGRAINEARKSPKGEEMYNTWCQEGRPGLELRK